MIRDQTTVTVFLKTEKPDAAVIGSGSGLLKIIEKTLYRIWGNHFLRGRYMIIPAMNVRGRLKTDHVMHLHTA